MPIEPTIIPGLLKRCLCADASLVGHVTPRTQWRHTHLDLDSNTDTSSGTHNSVDASAVLDRTGAAALYRDT